jgi:hypothetical protein
MARPSRSWEGVTHILAHAGFALAHLSHDPILAALYALLLCGDLCGLLARHRRP